MSIQSWYEKAQIDIDQCHENGEMTDREYREAVRDLNREYDDYAREEAENTYNSFY